MNHHLPDIEFTSVRTTLIFVFLVAVLSASGGCAPGSPDVTEAGDRPHQTPDSAAAEVLVRAQQALEEGALGKALMLTDSVRAAAPGLADAYFLRARIFSSMQRPDSAEAAYFEVLDRDPSYRGVWLNLGNAAFQNGAFDLALERYRNELAVQPSPRVWVAIGSTYEEVRQPDSARFAYDRAIDLDSTYASAYLHLGQLYKSTGALDRAVDVSRKGVRLAPQNVDYRYALGSLLILAGDAEGAIPHLEAVADARPWHYWSLYNLGRAFRQVGRTEDAERYIERAQQMQAHLEEIEYWQGLATSNADQFMLWAKLADALSRAGRASEAEEARAVATSLVPRYMVHQFDDPAAASAHRAAAAALIGGDAASAAERYRSFLDAAPSSADVWLNLGVVYAASGDVDGARAAWETALQRAPEHPGVRTLLFQLSQPYVPGRRTQRPGAAE